MYSNRKLVGAGYAETGIGDRNLYSLFVAHKQLRRAVIAFTGVPTGVFVDRVGMIEVNPELCVVGVINLVRSADNGFEPFVCTYANYLKSIDSSIRIRVVAIANLKRSIVAKCSFLNIDHTWAEQLESVVVSVLLQPKLGAEDYCS